jgi:hypothetical protein
MKKIDWSKMTGQEIWDALTSSPDVASKWTRNPASIWTRYALSIRPCFGIQYEIAYLRRVRQKKKTVWLAWSVHQWLTITGTLGGEYTQFKTLKAAKEAADKALVAAGWRLV